MAGELAVLASRVVLSWRSSTTSMPGYFASSHGSMKASFWINSAHGWG